MLCESPWNGGGGYTPNEVGDMSLDQILFRLCEIKILKDRVGSRTLGMDSLSVISKSKDGVLMGRSSDGKPIKGRIGGKSLARQLMEQEAEKKRSKRNRRRRRK